MGLSFLAWCVGPSACSAVSPGCCCFHPDLQAWMLGPFHVPSCSRAFGLNPHYGCLDGIPPERFSPFSSSSCRLGGQTWVRIRGKESRQVHGCRDSDTDWGLRSCVNWGPTKLWINNHAGFPVAQMVKNLPAMQETQFDPWIMTIPWRSEWLPTPVFLPGEFHGQRSLADYSPWGPKESDTTEWLNTFTFTFFQPPQGWAESFQRAPDFCLSRKPSRKDPWNLSQSADRQKPNQQLAFASRPHSLGLDVYGSRTVLNLTRRGVNVRSSMWK